MQAKAYQYIMTRTKIKCGMMSYGRSNNKWTALNKKRYTIYKLIVINVGM